MSRNDLLLFDIPLFYCIYIFMIGQCRRIVNGQCPYSSLKRDDATRPASRENCEQRSLAVVSNVGEDE